MVGAPEYVEGPFWCGNNQLTSFDYVPIIEVEIYCGGNPINNIRNVFKTTHDLMSSLDYGYIRGNNIIRGRFKEACDEFNVMMPKEVMGYTYID